MLDLLADPVVGAPLALLLRTTTLTGVAAVAAVGGGRFRWDAPVMVDKE